MNRSDLIAPETYNIVNEIERHAADETKEAIIFEDVDGNVETITYAKLIQNSNKVGNIFKAQGLQKGDKVLIMMPRSIKTYEVYIAALKLGLIIIPSSEMLRTKDLQHRITHGEVNAVVVIDQCTGEFENIQEYDQLTKFIVGSKQQDWISIDEAIQTASSELTVDETKRDDIAILSYTSGTTGLPKAVIHTHGWGFAHIQTAPKHWLSITDKDTVWATAAPGWQKWIWSPFLSILGSGAIAFVYNGKFNAAKYLDLLEKHQINALCCTPTEYRLMAKLPNLSDYTLKHLHSAVSAGEPLNKEVIEQFNHNFNIKVRDGYGQTENTLLIAFLKDTESRPGAMGKAIPGSYVTVIDEDGDPITNGATGDIAVSLDSPSLFQGYFKDEERTEKSKRGNYYVTGDRARLDEHGYFWFKGREDDIIISSGYTIGPFEVEDSLTKHPKVQECAVVASPDEIRGNIVKAFVILQNDIVGDEALVKELQTYVKSDVAPYKYPRAIEFVSELPKTNSGKIRRVELREAEKEKYNKQS